MDSLIGYDKTLPIDLNGSSNPNLLTEVTFGGLMEYPDGSVPMVAKTNTGRMSPVRGRTMKEYDQQIGELKKENFDLKLRIYFLEERLQQKFGDEDVFKTNIHLKVEAESLKKELEQRNEMLQKASETLNNLTQRYSDELEKQVVTVKQDTENQLIEAEKRVEDAERDRNKFEKLIYELKSEIDENNNNRQQLTDECKDLKEDLDGMTKELEEKDSKLSELTNQLEKITKQLDDARVEAQQVENDLREELEKERMNAGRKDRDIQRLSILVKDSTNIEGDALLEKTHLQDEVEDKNKSLEKLRRKLDDQERVGKRRETMLGNLEDLLRDKEREKKELAAKIANLQKEAQVQKQERQQMKTGCVSLIEKLKEKNQECESLSDQLEMLRAELNTVKSELNLANMDRHKEIEQLKGDKTELEDRIGGFQERIANQEAELERLVRSLGRKEGELEGFKDLLKRAEESLSQSETAVESLQQQLKKERSFRDRDQTSQELLDLKNEEIQKLKKKQKDLEDELEEMDGKHRKEVNNYKREIDDLRSQLINKEQQYQSKLNELDAVAHKLDITVGTQGSHALPELSQILEEVRGLRGAMGGDRNIRIDVNPGSFTHVCSEADNRTSPGRSHAHTSRIPVRKGSGSTSSLPEDLDHLKKLVAELRARNKTLDNTLQATEETVRLQTQKMKHYKNMLIDHGLIPKSMSRSTSDPNLAKWSPCIERVSRQSNRYHSTDNLSSHRNRSMSPSPASMINRSLSPTPGAAYNGNISLKPGARVHPEEFQKLVQDNEKLKNQIDGYKRVLKVFQDRSSSVTDSKDVKVDAQNMTGPQPISSESASCLLGNWLDMIDSFLLELSQGDQNGHMSVTASTTEVSRLRRGLVQARGVIQSLSHTSQDTQDGVVSSTGRQWSPDSRHTEADSNTRTSSSASSASSRSPTSQPINPFTDSQFSVQQSDDQSVERLRHDTVFTDQGPVSMFGDLSELELDNSVFSTQTKGGRSKCVRNIPASDNTTFKEPFPKESVNHEPEISFKEQTLDVSERYSPLRGNSEPNEKSSSSNSNGTFSNIYDKTFSSSFIGQRHPHYDTINESTFEASHILEHNGSSSEGSRHSAQGSQYELDRLQSRIVAMEKLHNMMKNEVEIYRKVANQNKAQLDNPLLQHLEELRTTRMNLEKELSEKEKDYKAEKEAELLKKETTIQELRALIHQLRNQLDECQNSISEKITIINEKEKILHETNIKLAKEKENFTKELHDVESYKEKIRKVEEELSESKSTVAKFTDIVKKLKTALEQYKRREDQLEGDIKQHMEVANKYQRVATELEMKLNESEDLSNKQNSDLEKLKQTVFKLEEECRQCKTSEDQYKAMLGEGRLKICELSECVNLLNEEAQKKESDIEELRNEIEQCTRTIESQVEDVREKESLIETQRKTINGAEEIIRVKDNSLKEQIKQLEGHGLINIELTTRLEKQTGVCLEQKETIDKQSKMIKDLKNNLKVLEESESSSLNSLKDDYEKRLVKKNSEMKKILQSKENMEAKLTKCSQELHDVTKKRDKYLHNLKVVYPEYKRKSEELEDAVKDMKKYRAEWMRYQEQLEEMSDMNRTLKLEISVHETLSSEKPVSEGDRQYIIVQLLAEIKKLKEIMEVYIERQKKQREQNEKLLDELNKHKRQFQVPEAMDGQPTPERPSPLGDQPDGGAISKETVIHTVTRDIEHRLNVLQSPNTTASSDSGNIDEPDQSFGGNVTWPQAKERLSGDNQDINSLSSSLPLESGHSLNGNGRLGSDGDTSTVVGSPKCFSIPGPLYKQGITDQCLHYNVHDSPKYLASLTQIRIDSDDRTLFAIGMIDHYEKLQKEISECHVILRGMATRMKERLKIFGTMPASESMEYSTLKELSLATENLRICLEEEKSLIGCFWMSELPAPDEKGEFVNKKQIKEIGELKDELSSIHAKYNFMCEKMSSANQRLYNTNMQRMISEEEISKSLQSTTDVITQARHNLEQSQKRRNSPRSSPKAAYKQS